MVLRLRGQRLHHLHALGPLLVVLLGVAGVDKAARWCLRVGRTRRGVPISLMLLLVLLRGVRVMLPLLLRGVSIRPRPWSLIHLAIVGRLLGMLMILISSWATHVGLELASPVHAGASALGRRPGRPPAVQAPQLRGVLCFRHQT